ncbi:methionyl-tRNA formyltransferase [Chloroflexota bacterium]
MRIIIMGQAAFGESVIQALIKKNEEIVGIYTSPDIPGRINPLKELAVQLDIPVFQFKNFQTPEVYNQYIKLKPDLNIMAYVTDIIPEIILNYPKLGTIQYHPSLLPKHRGGSAINWAIINGEDRTGITIFWPDKGIDTGPILLQRKVEIDHDDTVGSLYFDKLFPLGIKALVDSVELVKKGTAPRIPQDELVATYEGLCTEKNAVINWSQPATKIYNLIRGANPQPGAITYFQGKRFQIFDSALLTCSIGSLPGELINTTEQGFTVAAVDGAILVKRVRLEGSPKIASPEFAKQVHVRVGDKLGE